MSASSPTISPVARIFSTVSSTRTRESARADGTPELVIEPGCVLPGLTLRPPGHLGQLFGTDRVPAWLASGRLLPTGVSRACNLALGSGPLPLRIDSTGELVACELSGYVVTDDDGLPAVAVSRAEGPRVLEVGRVESDLSDRTAQHSVKRSDVLSRFLAQLQRAEWVRRLCAGDASREVAACQRDLERRAVDVSPLVRLVGVLGMQHLAGRERAPGGCPRAGREA